MAQWNISETRFIGFRALIRREVVVEKEHEEYNDKVTVAEDKAKIGPQSIVSFVSLLVTEDR